MENKERQVIQDKFEKEMTRIAIEYFRQYLVDPGGNKTAAQYDNLYFTAELARSILKRPEEANGEAV